MFRKNMWAALLAMLLALPVWAQQWVKVTPATSPPAALVHGMAYDAGGAQVVLFGGVTAYWGGDPIGTWTWNGTTWVEKYVPDLNYWRALPALAAFGNDVLLFGSQGAAANDTWKWSSNTWIQAANTAPTGQYIWSPSVSAFGSGVLAYEYTSDKNNETWVWNGTWTKVLTSEAAGYAGPLMRFGSSMAYDAARGRAVLFGGAAVATAENPVVNETWEWNGSTWTQKFPLHSPPARAFSAMAFDAASGVVVLFGGASPGLDGTTVTLDDTWTWNGTDWTQLVVSTSPSPRLWSAMAYDAAHGQVVMYGGTGSDYSALGDTWIFQGSQYTALVQQPINPDGTSVFKANRGVIPLKFTLKNCGVQTCTLPPAAIVVNRLSAEGGSSVVNEGEYIQNADAGSNFRIDQPNCQYVYNLAASALGAGTYRVDIVIGGKVVGSATFKIA